jgi:hypothetical protein
MLAWAFAQLEPQAWDHHAGVRLPRRRPVGLRDARTGRDGLPGVDVLDRDHPAGAARTAAQKERRDEVVEKYHAIEGGQQTLSNLAASATEIVRNEVAD